MEHFSQADQPYLNKFLNKTITFKQLKEEYDFHSDEGFDLQPYHPLLEFCR